jgi:hypothetical protein
MMNTNCIPPLSRHFIGSFSGVITGQPLYGMSNIEFDGRRQVGEHTKEAKVESKDDESLTQWRNGAKVRRNILWTC